MTDRCAKSLNVLLEQVNALSPDRNKSSDGWIVGPNHTLNSDHAPRIHDPDGTWVVTARDFTNDPTHGMPSDALAHALTDSQDDRIKYVISNAQICSGTGQDHEAWKWRPYDGENPHDHHCHISVKSDKAHYDNPRPWKFEIVSTQPMPQSMPPELKLPVLRRGSKGTSVKVLQQKLLVKGYALQSDGDFGPQTEKAVKALQLKSHLTVDGIVGPYTWRALEQ